jgi:hypothetical protein
MRSDATATADVMRSSGGFARLRSVLSVFSVVKAVDVGR